MHLTEVRKFPYPIPHRVLKLGETPRGLGIMKNWVERKENKSRGFFRLGIIERATIEYDGIK